MGDVADRRGRGWTRRLQHNSPRTLLRSLLSSHVLMKFGEQVSREECVDMRTQMQIVSCVQHRLLDLQFPPHFGF